MRETTAQRATDGQNVVADDDDGGRDEETGHSGSMTSALMSRVVELSTLQDNNARHIGLPH